MKPFRISFQKVAKIGGVFCLFFLVFFLIQYFHQEGFFCPDSYYHIKRAYLLRTEGFLGTMPWMQFTVVRARSMDIAFLFWVFLVPFTFGNLLWGAKLAIATFAGIFFALFFWLLMKWKVKKPHLWLFLLFISSPSLVLMLSLTRPHILAVSFVLLTIYFAAERKYPPLFVLGVFYTLAYEAFFIFLVISFAFLVSEFIFLKRINARLILSSVGGVLFGILLHPYPWDYIYLSYWHLFRVPYYRFSGAVSLGAGLYGAPANTFLMSMPFFLILIFALFLLFSQIKKFKTLPKASKILIFSLFFLLFFFFAITWVSGMFIYYLLPTGILLFALIFKCLFDKQYFLPMLKLLKRSLGAKIAIGFLLISWFFSFSWVFLKILKSQDRSFYYQRAATWLADNTPSQSIVFQSNWDSFPALFFYNTHNYYLLGLDQSFMYEYNQELFWKWYNLVNCGVITINPKVCDSLLASGQDLEKFEKITTTQEIYKLIKNNFHSNYIFADTEYKNFIGRLEEDKELFQERYQDAFVKVFELK